MRRLIFCTLLLGLFTALVPPTAAAQSLGDLAKQQADRRKAEQVTGKSDGKVLTNKDVPFVPQTAAAPTSAEPASTDPAVAGTVEPAQPAADANANPESATDEKAWSDRFKSLQDKLSQDQTLFEALQSRINALTADFVNRDDPAQRGVIATDRQKALDELSRMNATIAADRKAIEDFEDEARRANVPAGWLR